MGAVKSFSVVAVSFSTIAAMYPTRVGFAFLVEFKDQLVVVEVVHDPLSEPHVGNAGNLEINSFSANVLGGVG